MLLIIFNPKRAEYDIKILIIKWVYPSSEDKVMKPN